MKEEKLESGRLKLCLMSEIKGSHKRHVCKEIITALLVFASGYKKNCSDLLKDAAPGLREVTQNAPLKNPKTSVCRICVWK